MLRHVLPHEDPRALVGVPTADDAAVYLMDEDRAIVVTVDFFTPIVDDPYDFGRIAVANALSDLYAMGARPLFGLNLVAFPRAHLEEGILGEVLRGGADKAAEAGISVLGGHSIDDPEPKFGMVAVGEVDPSRIVTNDASREGDLLILTKPLGTGIVATAIKEGAASPELIRAVVDSMALLNREASEIMLDMGIRAATDITGFGLLGHLRNLLRQSGAASVIESVSVPRFANVASLIREGHVPGGSRRNSEDVAADVVYHPDVDDLTRVLLADAQTSGGLLISTPPDRVSALLERLRASSPWAAVIGRVEGGPPGHIMVV